MTRHAQIAQHPTLDQLTDTAATFTDGEVFSITLPRVSWVAMGRPLDLQVIVTPKTPPPAPATEDTTRPSSFTAPDGETQDALDARRQRVWAMSARYPTWGEDAQFVAGMLGAIQARIEPGEEL